MITVVDAGTGNLRSVQKALQFVAPELEVRISADPSDIRGADRLVLPGQGAINTWMAAFDDDQPFAQAIDHALNNLPVLGICLGLQALFANSEEGGGVDCLGRLDGRVRHFRAIADDAKFAHGGAYKIPHMGWNEVQQQQSHPLWRGIDDAQRFYFVHSYYVDAADQGDVVGTTDYGSTFTSAIARDNIFATQFHPEKSAQAGLTLLKNFCSWNPQ